MRPRVFLLLLSVALLLAACDPDRSPGGGGTGALRISSLSTYAPSVGGDLTIYGAGFSVDKPNTVSIGGKILNQGSIQSVSYGQIKLTVPHNTPNGYVTITNGNGESVTHDEILRVVASVEIDPLTALPGTRIYPITVRAKDKDGLPVPGARLALTSGDRGTFTPGRLVITEDNGEAHATLDLTDFHGYVDVYVWLHPLYDSATFTSPGDHLSGTEVTLWGLGGPYPIYFDLRPDGMGAISTLNQRPEQPPVFSSASLSSSPAIPEPREIIVTYRTDPAQSSAAREDAIATAGLQRTATVGGIDLLRVPEDQDLEQALEILNADPRVAYAEPNHLVRLAGLPADPLITKQWGTYAVGAPIAWQVTDAEGITVAVIDSAIDTTHPDLVDVLLPGYDFCADNIDCITFDDDPHSATSDAEHGTHVAGIIAAAHDNAYGTAGIAPGARILPIKVFGEGEEFTTTLTIAHAVRWAAGLPVAGAPLNPNPAQVINLSLGGDSYNRTLADAIDAAVATGVVVVAATGNEFKGTVNFPANLTNVIGVGAIGPDWQRAAYSNYGVGLDIVAPGTAILASKPGGDAWYMTGTSMATPHVAGAAALLLAANPHFTPEDVKAFLTYDAYMPQGASASEFGGGVLRVEGAIGLPAPRSDADRFVPINIWYQGPLGPTEPEEIATLDLRDGVSTSFYIPRPHMRDPSPLKIQMTHRGHDFTGTLIDW